MPPPHVSRSLFTYRRSPNYPPALVVDDFKTLYWTTISRALSITLALMFVPMVAVPMGTTDLIIAMLAGVSISVLWDVFAICYRCFTRRFAPWQLAVTFDIIVIPTMLTVFGASAYMDGLAPQYISPDEYERTIMALVLFVLVSVFHLIAVILEVSLTLTTPKPSLTSPMHRVAVKSYPARRKCKHEGPVRNCPAAVPLTDIESAVMMTIPDDALIKQSSEETEAHRISALTGRDALPVYEVTDPAGSLPAYRHAPEERSRENPRNTPTGC